MTFANPNTGVNFESPLGAATLSPSILLSDLGTLYWLRGFASRRSQELLGMISNRQFYRRVFVSIEREQDKADFWKTCEDHAKLMSANERLDAQQEVSGKMLEWIKKQASKHKVRLSDEMRNRPEERQAFLLDIPRPKEGEVGVRYVGEQDRLSAKGRRIRSIELERESVLGRLLFQGLFELAAKVRLFAHPKLETEVQAVLTAVGEQGRNELHEIIVEAIKRSRRVV